jgi:sporulation protein YtfJ
VAPGHAEAAERRGEGEGGAERCKAARNSTHSAGRRGTYDHINFDKGELTMEMTEKKNDLKSMMVESMEKVKEMVDANNIVGEPITTPDGVTLIPISRLSYGFGCGGGDYGKNKEHSGAGCGAGVRVEPMAFLVVKGGVTRMLPVGTPAITTVDRVIEMVPELLDRVEGFVDKKRNKDF